MAFCSKCGVRTDDQTALCPQCDHALSGMPGASTGPTQSELPENAAAALCYALGWVTGIVFLVIDDRPTVRFHAAQSTVVFSVLTVVKFVSGLVFGAGMFFGGIWTGFSAGMLLVSVVDLVGFGLWIVCMVTAAQGKRFEIPFAALIAQSIVAE
jgi:uncharacterized membrane protein